MEKILMIGVWALWGVACEPQKLEIERISPRIGLTSGGEKITVFGQGLETVEVSSIYIGNLRVSKMGTISDFEMWFNTPESTEPGIRDVQIVMADGRVYRIPVGFEYMRRDKMAECVNISKKLNGTFE